MGFHENQMVMDEDTNAEIFHMSTLGYTAEQIGEELDMFTRLVKAQLADPYAEVEYLNLDQRDYFAHLERQGDR